MIEVNFSTDLIQAIAEHRTPFATVFFQTFTFLGEIEGYVLMVAAIYAAFDKHLAIRLAVLVLVTMTINHAIKTIIANPRPFVSEGTFSRNWAVSHAKAAELAAEHSTPSGHAMAGGSFYALLFASVKSHWVKSIAVAALFLTGISRPYLGVHYVEDILLGWPIGIAFALVARRLGGAVGNAWFQLSTPKQCLIAASLSACVVAGSSLLYSDASHGQPLPFVSYLGLLSGLSVAYPLEMRWINFNPRSSSPLIKMARVGLGVALVMGTLLVLDLIFAKISTDGSALGNALRYLRYSTAGLVGMLGAPYLYMRLGWADAAQQNDEDRREIAG